MRQSTGVYPGALHIIALVLLISAVLPVGAPPAPIAGTLSDERSPRFVVQIDIALVLAAVALFWRWMPVSRPHTSPTRAGLLSLAPPARNRVNTSYIVGCFSGGAIGSLAGF